ncbi:MAG: hypothetical protein HQ557_10820 [Bacteroidetes bacterium]|nr:hypothetical protein [Bacteroidota bacterium]
MKKLLKRLSRQHRTSSLEVLSDSSEGSSLNPGEGVGRLVLNRKPITPGDLQERLTAIFSPGSLTVTGGILLKAGLSDNTFFLGILPNYNAGERGYHYDIHLPVENEFTLIGGITAQRELTILFKCTDVNDEKRVEYRRAYRVLARVINQCSGNDAVTLDWITVKLIEEQQVFSKIPENLVDIIRETSTDE